jgi:hypothetical protein
MAHRDFLFVEKNRNKIKPILYSSFDYKTCRDELRERRYRHLLALSYIELLKKEISLKDRVRIEILKLWKYHKIELIIGFVILSFTIRPISDRLSSVESLANKIHERSIYTFSGAVCNDGSESHSQGRGTCSWHHGVNRYFYKGSYGKSMKESYEEARKISWVGEN